jgi:hypothetical protein
MLAGQEGAPQRLGVHAPAGLAAVAAQTALQLGVFVVVPAAAIFVLVVDRAIDERAAAVVPHTVAVIAHRHAVIVVHVAIAAVAAPISHLLMVIDAPDPFPDRRRHDDLAAHRRMRRRRAREGALAGHDDGFVAVLYPAVGGRRKREQSNRGGDGGKDRNAHGTSVPRQSMKWPY